MPRLLKPLEVLKISRPIYWINTAIPFLVGYWVVSHTVDWKLIIGTLFFLIPYNLIMYGINDIYDYESDVQNPRKGTAEGAVVERDKHTELWKWIISLGVPFIALMLFWGSAGAGLWFIFNLFMVVAYSLTKLRFKEIPVLDSFTSSTHFYAPFVYGLWLADGGFPGHYLPAILAFLFWGMGSHSFGAVQDILSDRKAKIRSIATVFGARVTIIFSSVCYLIASATLALLYGVPGFVAGLVLLLYVVNTARFLLLTDRTSERSHAGWKVFLWLNWVSGALLTITGINALREGERSLDALGNTYAFVILAVGVTACIIGLLSAREAAE